MKNFEKYSLAWICLLIVGCSALFSDIAPTKSSAQTEYPTTTAEEITRMTISPTVAAIGTPSPTQPIFTMVEIEQSTEDFATLVRLETQKAKFMGQSPYLEIYADWCSACRALLKSMDDERMREAYRGTYIILVNIDVWKYQLLEMGINVVGVPAIYELTYDGKPTGRFITGAAWGENTPENMAPVLDEFFHPD